MTTPAPRPASPRLSRPRRPDRVVAGVCAGLARRFGWNPTVVRLVFVASVVVPGSQVLVYLVLWALLPSD